MTDESIYVYVHHLLVLFNSSAKYLMQLTKLTTKSACVPPEVSGLDTYAYVSEFHVLVDCSLA